MNQGQPCNFSAKPFIKRHVVECIEKTLLGYNTTHPSVTGYSLQQEKENMKQRQPYDFSAKSNAFIKCRAVECIKKSLLRLKTTDPSLVAGYSLLQKKDNMNQRQPCDLLFCYYCNFSANSKTIIRQHVVECMKKSLLRHNLTDHSAMGNSLQHKKENMNRGRPCDFSAESKPFKRVHVECIEKRLLGYNATDPSVTGNSLQQEKDTEKMELEGNERIIEYLENETYELLDLAVYFGRGRNKPARAPLMRNRAYALFEYFGIIPRRGEMKNCPICRESMIDTPYSDSVFGWRYRCFNNHRKSVLNGTFLENSRHDIAPHKIFLMSSCFLAQDTVESVSKRVKVSKLTVTHWNKRFRAICQKIAWHDFVQLGGVDDIVEIDETKANQKMWVFGGISRKTRHVFGFAGTRPDTRHAITVVVRCR